MLYQRLIMDSGQFGMLRDQQLQKRAEQAFPGYGRSSEQAILVQDLLLQQRLHQGVFERFQLGFGQPAQHRVDRVQMRQPQPDIKVLT